MEPLKDRIDARAIRSLGARFGVPLEDRCAGYEALELKERAAFVANALAPDVSLRTFIAALVEPIDVDAMVYFVHSALLLQLQEDADFDLAMAANAALTERFTAEFTIRPLLERDPERGVAHLQFLARSESEHHRRLVSEGTRPRLPWAARLRAYEDAYAPIDELLVDLADDDALYVRRSVANHIGDLAKDDLEHALALCAQVDNAWVKSHALRHPVKLGDARALAALGYARADVVVTGKVTPSVVRRGERVAFEARVENRGAASEVVIDVVVAYVKKDGSSSPKTFKLFTGTLNAGQAMDVRKNLATHDLSTRVHWSGEHVVHVQVNGARHNLGSFQLH